MDNNYENNQYNPNTYNPYSSSYENDDADTDFTGTANPYGGSYSYGGNGSYGGSNSGDPSPEKNTGKNTRKKKSGFGKKLARTAALALVFGLVSGSAFFGVNQIGNTVTGKRSGTSSEAVSETQEQESSSTILDNSGTISATATGMANELTDVSSIVEEVMPSVVAITNTSTVTYQSIWGRAQTYESSSCGSGIIIDQDSEYLYVATNNHVVSGAKTLTVQFINDTVVNAEVQGTYSSKDLAVVKVKLTDIDSETLSTIKVATVGDSSSIKVGESSIAIGNALGYGQSVTTGIISAKGRTITVSDSTDGSTVTNSNLLQTDAAINPGNSGGALLNSKGEVIGINSAKYSETSVEGVGYAIPMEDALPIIQALIEKGSYVNAQTAYLGISGTDITSQYAQTYRMPEGVYILEVTEGSGAEKAELQEGDIITAVEDTEISSMDELKSLIGTYKAGDTVKLTVYRQKGNGYKGYYVNVELMSAADLNIEE